MTTVSMCGPSAITTSIAWCKSMTGMTMVAGGSSGVPSGSPFLMKETAGMQGGWIPRICTTLTSTSTT
ncbi:hypothetical protein HU200_037373 [Digitaria exilis]|uniref:Uncharacterized protein n=1 Tax=Digitaria exilis TaxID=1010633 RepID=A0A835BFE1_9POAL|nr:hypothetical protein HU200_037373 [Digitaria exilis]